MDITLLEHFLIIAETQSFTKAADILDKSESVLSRQMARLEDEIGLQLFNRSNRRITLTPAAKVFYSGASEVIRKYYQSINEAHDIQSGASGIIHLGIFENHMMSDSVMQLLQGFQHKYPKILVELESRDVFALRQSLKDGELDLFYSATSAFQEDKALSVLPCGSGRNYLVVSKSHPAAGRDVREMKLSDFKDDRFIIRENAQNFMRKFSETCSRSGFVPHYVFVSDQTQMLTMALMGSGVLVMNETHFFVKNRDVIALPLRELSPLEFGFFYEREKVSGCCRTLLDFLTAHPVD